MFGAITGDIIGSVFEGRSPESRQFPLLCPTSRFTDDTVMTLAIASAIRHRSSYAEALREWGRRYPQAGYGDRFGRWLRIDDAPPYRSYGNGSAMRVSAVGWAYDELNAVLLEAQQTALVTHNHPEGIKGAQAVAGAVFLARRGQGKEELKCFLSEKFGYRIPNYAELLKSRMGIDVTCQGTVPIAAAAFLESSDFEDAVRNAVRLGGDADTLACITGSMAEAFYGGVPPAIWSGVVTRLDASLARELTAFARQFGVPSPDPVTA